MAVKQVYLSVGDYPASTDFVNLADGNNFICPPEDGLSAPPPSVHRFHSRTRGEQLQTADYRTVTLKLQVFGGAGAGTTDAMLANIAAIEKKGRQARLASGPLKRGTPVSLAVMLSGGSQWSYFDVQDVRVAPAAHLWGPVATQEITVEITCLPGIRGTVVQETLGPILTNGTGADIYRAGVLGDLPASVQLTLADNSVSTSIRRLRISAIGGEDQFERGFTHVNTGVTNGPNASTTGSTGVLTGSASRLTPNSLAMDTVGQLFVAQNNTLYGNLHVYGVVRDSGTTLTPPTAVSAEPYYPVASAIALPAGFYHLYMTSLDASGNESSPSTVANTMLTGDQGIIVSWVPAQTAVTVNLYMQIVVAGSTTNYVLRGIDPSAGSVQFYLNTPLTHGAIPDDPSTQPTITSIGGLAGQSGATLPAGEYIVLVGNLDVNGNLSGLSFPVVMVLTYSSATLSINLSGETTRVVVFYQINRTGPWYLSTQVPTTHNVEVAVPDAQLTGEPPLFRVPAPTSISASATTGGSLGAGNYTARIWSLDAEGYYGLTLTTAGPIALSGANTAISISLLPAVGQAFTVVDLLTPANTYTRFLFGAQQGVTNSYKITTLSNPSIPSNRATTATLQAGIALTANDTYIDGPIVPSPVGGSVWRLAYLGLFPLPPLPIAEGQTNDSYILRMRARASSYGAGTVDLAGFIFIPEDEPHFLAEVPAALNPGQSTWVLDDPRDRLISGRLQSSGADTVSLRTSGQLRLAPGNNTIAFIMETLLNAYDTANLKLQAQIRYIPTYVYLRGNDVDTPYQDSFNRVGLSRADSGQLYAAFNGSYGISGNALVISSRSTTYLSYVSVNLTTGNGTLQATVVNPGAGVIRLYFRVRSTTYWYAVECSATVGIKLLKVATGDAVTTIASSGVGQVSAGSVVKVNFVNGVANVFLNGTGVLFGVAIDNDPTATGVGLGGTTTGVGIWDAVSFTST